MEKTGTHVPVSISVIKELYRCAQLNTGLVSWLQHPIERHRTSELMSYVFGALQDHYIDYDKVQPKTFQLPAKLCDVAAGLLIDHTIEEIDAYRQNA